LGSKGY
jgi:hypothetical protein